MVYYMEARRRISIKSTRAALVASICTAVKDKLSDEHSSYNSFKWLKAKSNAASSILLMIGMSCTLVLVVCCLLLKLMIDGVPLIKSSFVLNKY